MICAGAPDAWSLGSRICQHLRSNSLMLFVFHWAGHLSTYYALTQHKKRVGAVVVGAVLSIFYVLIMFKFIVFTFS